MIITLIKICTLIFILIVILFQMESDIEIKRRNKKERVI